MLDLAVAAMLVSVGVGSALAKGNVHCKEGFGQTTCSVGAVARMVGVEIVLLTWVAF